LAKQFGVSDAALDGLKDPARHTFPPDQKAALLFADAMTDGPGHVPDPVYEELRRHFNETQIVEIACVIGLFNYFNRFNNALHVEVTLTDPDVIVRRIEEAAAAGGSVADLCDRVADILHQGRRYVRVEIYQRDNDRLVLRAWRGPTAPPASFRLGEGDIGATGQSGVTRVTGKVLVVPAVAIGEVVGVVEIEAAQPAAIEEEDRPLVERVATVLAARLT
jgi:putative methionine-R-sulfoxide reductase with GAF domain